MPRLTFPLSKGEAKENKVSYSSAKNKNALFPSRLRELRNNVKLSQEKISGAIGVTKSTISLYENGDNVPDIKTFVKIADYFNVSYDYLLGKSENKQRENTDIGKYLGLSDKAINQIRNAWEKTLENTEEGVSDKFNNLYVLNTLFESSFFENFSYKALVLLWEYVNLHALKDHIIEILDEDVKNTLVKTFDTMKKTKGITAETDGYDDLTREEIEDLKKSMLKANILQKELWYKFSLWQLQENIKNIIENVVESLYNENKKIFPSLLEEENKKKVK